MADKMFKVFIDGKDQDSVFSSEELCKALQGWIDTVGGNHDVQIREVQVVKPSKEFKVGVEYYCRSLYDSDCIFRLKVVKRTEKSVWVEGSLWNKRCVVKKDADGCEYFMPEHYSMAPVFRATKVSDGIHDRSSWGTC